MSLEDVTAADVKHDALHAGAGLSVTLPDGTAVVRRVIDADNSCLFNAVGYVMQGSRSRAPALRFMPPCAYCQRTLCLPQCQPDTKPAT